MIKPEYLSLVINVVAKFASQEQDLNISLTAIVLLWNISDYMFQNTDNLNEEINKKLKIKEEDVNVDSVEHIWMVLYSRLGQLCVDPRPAVRKSAGQTLFCTISSHGSVLGVDSHWKDLVWSVLFPLLENVRQLTGTASREKDKHANHPNFLMHHSRDTSEKQWAETTVLTLSGVTRVFASKCWILMKLSNNQFHQMWLFLLNIIETSALSKNAEIALAALRAFHDLLGNQNYFSSASSFANSSNSAAQSVAAAAAAASLATSNNTNQPVNTSSNSNSNSGTPKQKQKNTPLNGTIETNGQNNSVKAYDIAQWLAAWKTWINIGNSLLTTSTDGERTVNDNFQKSNNNWPPPSQTFLTCFIDLVSVIVEKLTTIGGNFKKDDFEQFSNILDKLLSVPVISSDYSSFILMQVDNNLTPLQSSSLTTVKNFIKLFKKPAELESIFIVLIFQRLLSFVLYACYKNSQIQTLSVTTAGGNTNGLTQEQHRAMNINKMNEIIAINFVPFGEKALIMVTGLYEETAHHEAVIENSILKAIIQVIIYYIYT
jgi:hypothetical protein